MGAVHGVYCLGCCWALMLLLFAGGVMNLLCIALLTLFVLLEKLAPLGQRTAVLAGFVPPLTTTVSNGVAPTIPESNFVSSANIVEATAPVSSNAI